MKNTRNTLLAILATCGITYAQDSLTNTFNYPLNDVGLHRSFAGISMAYGVRICVERKMDIPEVSFSFTNATLGTVLDTVMSAHTNYVWSYESETDTYNIYSRENALMTWVYESLAITNQPLKDLFEGEDLLGFQEKRILFDTGRGSGHWLEWEVSLTMTNATARQVLNAVCAQLPRRKAWEIRETDPIHGYDYSLYLPSLADFNTFLKDYLRKQEAQGQTP